MTSLSLSSETYNLHSRGMTYGAQQGDAQMPDTRRHHNIDVIGGNTVIVQWHFSTCALPPNFLLINPLSLSIV